LGDGTELEADIVVSTASAPETVLRLLGGRYDAQATRDRMATWKLFDPIVLASFGVAQPYADQPGLLLLDGLSPSTIGDRTEQKLYVRVCNDDASFAPAGHCVVQAMVPTDYDFWAKRGAHYSADKDAVGDALIERLAPHFPGFTESVRMRDIATPLTYWSMARSWRGAYEGWMPSSASLTSSLDKKLPGLGGFYMAGQWVEPGGGVPTATLSGRQAAQLICADDHRPFVAT
jgi:phytoene dehydrogenase-like protein